MILINGQADSAVSVYDRGLNYGDGLFETIAVKNGNMPFWNLHWWRLIAGCKRLNILPPDEELVLEEINTALENKNQAVVKIILTRGNSGRGYRYTIRKANRMVIPYDWPEYHLEDERGIELYLCETRLCQQPALAGIKHLNRLENVLARNEWSDARYSEGLMLSTDDNVIEGTMSNVFWVKNHELFTPDLKKCGIEGVMRQNVLNLAETQGIKVTLGDFQLSEIYHADEMFMCNSIFGIWPVKQISNKRFNVANGENVLTQKLIELTTS